MTRCSDHSRRPKRSALAAQRHRSRFALGPVVVDDLAVLVLEALAGLVVALRERARRSASCVCCQRRGRGRRRRPSGRRHRRPGGRARVASGRRELGHDASSAAMTWRLRMKRLVTASRWALPERTLLARAASPATWRISGENSGRCAARLPMLRCSDHCRRPKDRCLQQTATPAASRLDQWAATMRPCARSKCSASRRSAGARRGRRARPASASGHGQGRRTRS